MLVTEATAEQILLTAHLERMNAHGLPDRRGGYDTQVVRMAADALRGVVRLNDRHGHSGEEVGYCADCDALVLVRFAEEHRLELFPPA